MRSDPGSSRTAVGRSTTKPPQYDTILRVKSQFRTLSNICLVGDILMSVTVQISTNVLKTAEVAVLMPAALTGRAISPVPVYLDTPEMDSPAQVNK